MVGSSIDLRYCFWLQQTHNAAHVPRATFAKFAKPKHTQQGSIIHFTRVKGKFASLRPFWAPGLVGKGFGIFFSMSHGLFGLALPHYPGLPN